MITSINRVTVTGQHPIHKNVFSTLLGNKRFDCNIESGSVWESMRPTGYGSFRNVTIKNKQICNSVLSAAKDFKNTLK